jgi:hypothetical protein
MHTSDVEGVCGARNVERIIVLVESVGPSGQTPPGNFNARYVK